MTDKHKENDVCYCDMHYCEGTKSSHPWNQKSDENDNEPDRPDDNWIHDEDMGAR